MLTGDHARRLTDDGYALAEGFLSPAELSAVHAALAEHTPDPQQVRAAPARHGNGQVARRFPLPSDTLNDILIRPDLLDWCRQVIGTEDLALSDALLHSKYGGLADFDQQLHQDFANNDLAYPRRDGGFLQITAILYLTDVGAGDGPTAVVPRRYYGDETRSHLGRPDAGHPLYRHEVKLTCPAGSLLLYDTLTYHRGTAMTDPDGVRHVLFLQYADGRCRWIGKYSWGHAGGRPEMDRLMTRATPSQREVIGFPPVGHPYWDADTLRGVARRYPGMDVRPYAEAAGLPLAEPRRRWALLRRGRPAS